MRNGEHTGNSFAILSNMAAQNEGGGKDEIKTQFATREGTYKLMTLSEYSRPNRVAYNGQGNTPVRVSFINVNDQSGTGDRVCFNVGRELYFYMYKGVRKVSVYPRTLELFPRLLHNIPHYTPLAEVWYYPVM